jgi:hypothetical protein
MPPPAASIGQGSAATASRAPPASLAAITTNRAPPPSLSAAANHFRADPISGGHHNNPVEFPASIPIVERRRFPSVFMLPISACLYFVSVYLLAKMQPSDLRSCCRTQLLLAFYLYQQTLQSN